MKKDTVFCGDSLVAGWDIAYYFPYLDIQNNGINGAKINDVNLNIVANDATLVLLVGTNDIGSYGTNLPVDFYDNLVSILKQKLINCPAKNLVLISILPRSDENALQLNEEIKNTNRLLEKLSTEIPNIKFLNVYDCFTDNQGLLNSNFSTDGVHINSYGYELLSAKLSATL